MTTLKNAIYQNVIESLKEFGYLDVNEKTIFTNLEYRNFLKHIFMPFQINLC